MKKEIKVALATTVALGTFAVADLNSNAVPQVDAAEITHSDYVKPWYKYYGDAGYDATFVLDPVFINAVKHENVELNGIKLMMVPMDITQDDMNNTDKFEKYDQTFNYTVKKNYSYSTYFETKNDKLKIDDVRDVYGDYATFDDDGRYIVNVEGQTLKFEHLNGVVTEVRFGL